jgi:hypothetical protein
VPLSEHEQRLLDQIERALYADDPKFATAVRAANLRSHYRRRILRSALGFALGLLLLLVGVAAPMVALGVVGFLVMLASVLLGVRSHTRLSGQRDVPRVAAPKTGRRGRTPLRDRIEQRWRRRWEERGDR